MKRSTKESRDGSGTRRRVLPRVGEEHPRVHAKLGLVLLFRCLDTRPIDVDSLGRAVGLQRREQCPHASRVGLAVGNVGLILEPHVEERQAAGRDARRGFNEASRIWKEQS